MCKPKKKSGHSIYANIYNTYNCLYIETNIIELNCNDDDDDILSFFFKNIIINLLTIVKFHSIRK